MSQVFATQNIRYDWKPELREVEARLARMEAYYENEASLYPQAEFIGIRDMHHKFDTQKDPSGSPWTPLEPPQRPYPHDILQLTYAMRNAATDPGTWEATPEGLFFDESLLPPYYVHHDPGGDRTPPREFIDLTEDARASLEALFVSWVEGGMIIGSRGFVRETRSPLGQFARFE